QRGSLMCSASSHGPLMSNVPSGDGVGLGEELAVGLGEELAVGLGEELGVGLGEELGVGLGEELAATRTPLLVGASACCADSGPLARARAAIATRKTATTLPTNIFPVFIAVTSLSIRR
ncbi:MAG TPA: hypothetical protein VGZ50_08890, partial [Actinomycetota bacterium]|nr:hypothetical protein [Actinomycetota bacterium]